ncbi:HET-domain-containing protein [Stipitochalara longipes BDJ]|nr:HET-domain-containing protein [Stipitochalara longipes BDJ]
MNGNYCHAPLNSHRHQLRFLILHRGQEDEPIYCSLNSCLISKQEPYEALSYVWGDATITTPIYIGPLHKTFHVTTNLACALSHLRFQDKDRTLWVDALCINQGDDSEKSHQVRMMRTIYENAECVLAWLGPETPGEEAAIQALELLANDADLHWRPDGRSDRFGPSITTEQALGLSNWFRNSDWWTRIWTVQEYSVAKELVFLYGNLSIPKRQIEKLARNCFAHIVCCPWMNLPVPDGQEPLEETTQSILNEVYAIADIKSWIGYPSSECLLAAMFRTRQASKPEDKLFGLAGLMDGFDEEIINYGTSVEVIYEKFMIFMIQRSFSLDSFSQVVHPYREKHCNISSSSQGSLVINGVIWDTIATVGEALDDFRCRANAAIAKSWYDMAVTKLPEQEYRTGGTLENAFWRTICSDVVSHQLHHNWPERVPVWIPSRAEDTDYRAYKSWWQVLDTIKGNYKRTRTDFIDPISVNSDVLVFDNSVFASTCCRRFIISEKGYMGLAPAMAEPGDRIAVLFGGKVPYILRQNKTGNSTTWTFIGDSYVHGIMDGEVIKKLDAGEVVSEVIILN